MFPDSPSSRQAHLLPSGLPFPNNLLKLRIYPWMKPPVSWSLYALLISRPFADTPRSVTNLTGVFQSQQVDMGQTAHSFDTVTRLALSASPDTALMALLSTSEQRMSFA